MTVSNVKVGEIMAIGSDHGALGHGFNITSERGRPLLSITYRTAKEATDARSAIQVALANAVEVTSHG